MACLGFGFGFAESQFPGSFVLLEVLELELQVEGPLEVGGFIGVEVSEASGLFEVGCL